MGDKVGENPAALRAAVFLLSAKNRKVGVQTPPPSRAKVKDDVISNFTTVLVPCVSTAENVNIQATGAVGR